MTSIAVDQVYHGTRDGGVPTVVVMRDSGDQQSLASPYGAFSWGWPSTGGARRLAHALLLDLTGRDAPHWVLDTLAARELPRLPRAAFAITGRQILGWVESHGYSISDWRVAQQSLTDYALVRTGARPARTGAR
jgi:hypothetical protein